MTAPYLSCTFAAWLAEVDGLVRRYFEIGLSDLPDMATRDAYDGGCSGTEFVKEQVRDILIEEFGVDAVSELWPDDL
jgi:hypothetical protein